jgi:heme-degrading monooxygenase HmoA
MFARHVSIRLKSNMLPDFQRTFENEVLPLLRKQKGFKDEITLSNPGSQDVIAISLWENKANAEAYSSDTYPQVLNTLVTMMDGTPKVQTFEVVSSTFHKVAVAA